MAPYKRDLSCLFSLITFSKSAFIVSFGFFLTLVGSTGAAISYNAPRTTMIWDHIVDLNEDFRIMWTIINQDITFEIQARSLGYVGFGFSLDGNQDGADMAIGWVDKGHTYFQDRYTNTNRMLELDPSQDYILIKGYENATHTVIRFRRKLETCDNEHDISITNDTMRVIYLYNEEDPLHGSVSAGSLPNVHEAWRPHRSLILTQKAKASLNNSNELRVLEFRNHNVDLPLGDDTYIWCKMFKMDSLKKKHQLVKYEPVFDSSWSIHYLQQITIYECHGNSLEFEKLSRSEGSLCMGGRNIPITCNAIAASWARGSEGFTYPPEAGYPIETSEVKYYLMQTHYSDVNANDEDIQTKTPKDNSGLRLYLTDHLRPNDAGILSIGIDPNWRHIIPPGQKQVISQGQCLEDCTEHSFPKHGINIFAVMMKTHNIGKQVKLRQIRKNEEFPPIVLDRNIDSNYQDFRRLPRSVVSLPGDRLVAECIYDSSSREAITLGGLTMKEESCTVLTIYYPRQKKLTTCHSLPSLPTVLHSLGIEQLATNSNPVVISLPLELAGMTLETRLLSYDWDNQFQTFQDATLLGSFKPLCRNGHNEIIAKTEYLTGFNMNITKSYKLPRRCKPKRIIVTETIQPQLEIPVLQDIHSNHITEGSIRSSRSSLIETSLALSSGEVAFKSQSYYWYVLIVLVAVFGS